MLLSKYCHECKIASNSCLMRSMWELLSTNQWLRHWLPCTGGSPILATVSQAINQFNQGNFYNAEVMKSMNTAVNEVILALLEKGDEKRKEMEDRAATAVFVAKQWASHVECQLNIELISLTECNQFSTVVWSKLNFFDSEVVLSSVCLTITRKMWIVSITRRFSWFSQNG